MIGLLAAAIGTAYLVKLNYPPASGGLLVAVFIASGFLFAFIFHETVIAPCRATTKLHTVTNNLGNFYQTEYKDSGEWCLWIRSEF